MVRRKIDHCSLQSAPT